MSLQRQFNITSYLIFVLIYIVGFQFGEYISGTFLLTGIFATAASLTVVFVIAAWLLKFRMTLTGWLMFIIFGFISALLGQWIATAMGLGGILVSFLTGTILYFLLRQFTRTV